MVYVITGGAGYIGGHLTDYLVERGEDVVVIDDFSYGKYMNNKAIYKKIDLRSNADIEIPKDSILFHLAANPDVRTSMIHVQEHFERDVKVTLNTLEIARKYDVKKFIFASSSTVYGEAKVIPTPEDSELKPISNYGLFKLLGEEMVEYYSRVYSIRAVSVRLANVTGGRISHGVIYDFVNKLLKDSNKLEILGNGKQKKSYIYITDTIEGLVLLAEENTGSYSVYNLGNEDWITVDEIAKIVEEEMGVSPKHIYVDSGEGRGWVGDVRFMLLDIKKIKEIGWKPKYTSRDAVRLAVRDLLNELHKN
ncbi:NAD-dependent epimerase/dehydratase family protein [Sulfurisphaera ohwakuensis]|uniref:NAD-dependent epimerase/dehydratase family protein n=1 Tax=Sulfurisphaera ohwakuensis TaxID=69656 RepID=A0A650CD98_SULOH|nr:NAD-dependent epimerase/dehydratase family protein [Sulfurisphaera ohwakuensis]MBB5253276.1 UDP-glucose 4-epimerase [Sulfurisphaera ohwakuensis]QGR15820.1 NAD-dependent epimerase/dehydratase family protein [Sulfurisphaera ohwakuensis]